MNFPLDHLSTARLPRSAARRSHSLEMLEARIAPAVASVASIVHAGGTGPAAADLDSVPTLSVADVSVMEGNDGTPHAHFTVTLSGPSADPVTVDFATANGTAIAPGDYKALTGTLTFAPGDTTATIDVAIRPDTLFESGADETFLVRLSNPAHATLDRAQAVGTILSDEGLPNNSYTLNARHPLTFLDSDNDRVTVKLSGHGTGTLILNDGADYGGISEIHLDGNAAKSTLSITVKKAKTDGNGLVTLGEVTVDGALGSFSGKAVDFTTGGLRATGVVKAITAHSFSGELFTGGAATDKLALNFGGTISGDPFLISTPETISALTATSIVNGEIHAAAVTSLNVKAGDFSADVFSDGAIGRLTLKGGELSGHLSARNFGAVTITGGLLTGSLTSDTPAATLGRTKALASLLVTDSDFGGSLDFAGACGPITVRTGSLHATLTAASFGAITTTAGAFDGTLHSSAPLETLGRTKALTSLSITGGSLNGDITVQGAIGPITVRGDVNGHLQASSFGAVTLFDGDFRGSLTSLTPAATLGAIKALASLTLHGRMFQGDIRLLGVSGPIAFRRLPGGVGGDMLNATIVAGAITSLTVESDANNSLILAGADLGADFAIGGGDDTFGAGTIGAVKINRFVSGSKLGAGYSPGHPAVGGAASSIASLTITEFTDANVLFAAGQFKTPPRIGVVVIDPSNDARFKVG